MSSLNILLCDDNVEFLNYFQNKLNNIYSNYNIKCKFYSYSNFCAEIFEHNYDICYLDIELPNSSGFLIAERIGNVCPDTLIIFTTALSHLAIESFHYHPFDFITKDNLEAELERKTKTLIMRIRPVIYKSRIKGSDVSIPCDNIISVKKQGNNILISTIFKVTYTERKLLQDFEYDTKHYKYFVKIHRSIIVNMKHIVTIDYDLITFSNNKKERITRRLIKDVNKKYMEYKTWG